MRAASRALPGPRRLPGFLILGEKRCGTTSLHRYITQHPNVLGPLAPKSTHYFDTKFGKNLDWYGSYFWPETIIEKLERKNGPMLAGESSPYYFFHPTAPERIAQTLPDVKVLVLLREPAKRAWSNFQYERDKGNEMMSFAEAIAAEPARTIGEEQRLRDDVDYVSRLHRTFSYVDRGRYYRSLTRLYRSIPPDRVQVIRSEDLYGDTAGVMSTVQDFLGLAPVPVENTAAGRANRPEKAPVEVLQHIRTTLADDTAALNELLGRQLWGAT